MGLNLVPPQDRIVSLISATSLFDSVNKGELKSAPPKGAKGMSVWLFLDWIGPATGQSGLTSTTGRVVFIARLLTPMIQKPEDKIDTNIGMAAGKVMEVLTGDFELGGSARCIDLLAATGTPMHAKGGYLNIGGGPDGPMYRMFDVMIPVIINDIWDQEG